MRSRLDFGRAIETLRASKGLSREEAAALAGISSSYFAEVERGLKRPSADIVARVARAFGMSGSAFLQYVEELSAPLPEPEARARPVQLTLRRGRPLPLFSSDDAPASGPRRRRADAERDLVLNELLVIGRRLRREDRAALLHLARHLLHRGEGRGA
ncbi:MAG: helix-turn-helix transcriptional regulator [Armatimonadota bacterium]|nr:helix-turn-helix transcriptional regulator [Armatimonadota bacterium]MDR7421984.1 helix-turn-helix transcriptional regulator [Armatimonadota bacterium]MDR7456945.1 helix-turn-helix transcriptional regulator [Armatimonadota bacterium]MDR7496468.1 helix-turn-helix transcriptional regulator [Armatimonadota bacterium]MDR7511561.1 helix-turn-helix transcriptional regulator [Armatimonadota bacterium]